MIKKIFLSLLFMAIISCSFGEKEKNTENKNEKKMIEKTELKKEKTENCKEFDTYNINTEKIELKNKNIEKIDCIIKYTNLKVLDLRWNKIKDIKPLENLKQLEVLKIDFNEIEDITPLLSLTKLKELWIHNNKIRDIRGIKELKELKHLDLSLNPIKYGIEELAELRKLKRLELRKVSDYIVKYIYKNRNKFMNIEEINIKCTDECLVLEKFSDDFREKITDIPEGKVIRKIEPKEIEKSKIPKRVWEKIQREEVPVDTVELYSTENYNIYQINYYSEDWGHAHAIYLFNGERYLTTLNSREEFNLLESPEMNNFYAFFRDAHGFPRYIYYDFLKEKEWEDEEVGLYF